MNNANFVVCPVRLADSRYAVGELLWYLLGKNDVDWMLSFAPSYSKFAEPDDSVFGAYGYRIYRDMEFNEALRNSYSKLGHRRHNGQIEVVIELLRDKRNSRRAVISLWNAGDLVESLVGEKKDIPCTLALQFLVRGPFLDCICFMRSNDIWLGMPYDIFCFTTLARIISDALGLTPGIYTHNVGSLQLYSRHREKAVMALKVPPPNFSHYSFPPSTYNLQTQLSLLMNGPHNNLIPLFQDFHSLLEKTNDVDSIQSWGLREAWRLKRNASH